MNSRSLWIDSYCEAHDLPASFANAAKSCFAPLADELADVSDKPDPYVLGVNGAQGTGKSTFAKFLVAYLERFHNLRGVTVSLDDFYLTRAERLALSEIVHPLLKIRGVPGTHDVQLAISTLNGLKHLTPHKTYKIPVFDKLIDDRKPRKTWPKITGPLDIIVFEGWCVFSRPCPPETLDTPVNALERQEDGDGTWRHYVNEQLRGAYSELFKIADALIYLKAPNFESSRRWRGKQEARLIARQDKSVVTAGQAMNAAELKRFMQFYERITLQGFRDLPTIANYTIHLNEIHGVSHVTQRPPKT